ncbi:MAG: carotenoid biosynthesis protein [Bacteroidales bacterium]|nr:carotenoid biosynthesis protein [Bacteroidales bacterium]
MEVVFSKLKVYPRATLIRIIYVIFFGVGAAGLSFSYTRELFTSLMPFSLLLSMGLMFWMHDNWKTKHIIIFLIIALMGFFVEVAGVLTGVVFGEYSYGSALGFKIMGTPPLIGLNWLMLIYAVYLMMNRLHLHIILKIFLGAALMVVYDIIMEPVAINLDMWSWGGGDIPIQNYIAWFVISVVMLSIFYIAKLKYRNKVAPTLFFVQMAFFLILNLSIVF